MTVVHTNRTTSGQHWVMWTFTSVICPVQITVVNDKRNHDYKWLKNSVVQLVNTDTTGEGTR